jgi:predicted nucleic acid-binding protein
VPKTFVDTNILIYAEDADAGAKHERAKARILSLWASGEGAVSIQVLQEFYVNVTRKVKKPLKPKAAEIIVGEYLSWTVVENTRDMLRDAIALCQRSKLSFWDAMVVQAAISAGASTLLSEDLNHGQRFASVQVQNPFRD